MNPECKKELEAEAIRYRLEIKDFAATNELLTAERLKQMEETHRRKCREITDHYLSEHTSH